MKNNYLIFKMQNGYKNWGYSLSWNLHACIPMLAYYISAILVSFIVVPDTVIILELTPWFLFLHRCKSISEPFKEKKHFRRDGRSTKLFYSNWLAIWCTPNVGFEKSSCRMLKTVSRINEMAFDFHLVSFSIILCDINSHCSMWLQMMVHMPWRKS